MTKLYYEAPSDECFEDMRKCALKVWEQYKDDSPDYYEEKTARLRTIGNIKDNFMYMFAMFDQFNQRACANNLQPETRHQVLLRMVDGGNDSVTIMQALGVGFDAVVEGVKEVAAL